MRAAYSPRLRGTATPSPRYRAYKRKCLETDGERPHFPIMVRILINTARQLALKIASYGAMHLIVAILVAFALTRDWRLALAVGVVEPIFQTIAYSVHDRVWHRVERRKMLSGTIITVPQKVFWRNRYPVIPSLMCRSRYWMRSAVVISVVMPIKRGCCASTSCRTTILPAATPAARC